MSEFIDATNLTLLNRKVPFVMTINGQPGSGKSYLARFLIMYMYSNKIVDSVYVFRGMGNDDYSFMEKTGTICEDYDDNLIEEIINTQKQVKTDDGMFLAPPMLIVFDDMAAKLPREASDAKSAKVKKAQKEGKTVKTIQDLFSKFRHYNIRIMVISQSTRQIPGYVFDASLRGYNIVFRPNGSSGFPDVKKLMPDLHYMNGNALQAEIDKRLTEDYQAMTYDGFTSKSGTIRLVKPPPNVKYNRWRVEDD